MKEGGKLKRIWMNRKYIIKKTTECVCSLYAFLGFISLFVSFGECFPDDMEMHIKIVISILILIGIWILLLLCVSAYCINIKRVVIIHANNGYNLYVQYGELFDKNEVDSPNERRNIVIPVNRCFDTIVDNKIVSERTLHGIAFKKLYEQSKFTEKSLNAAIENLLKNQKYDLLNNESKSLGNHKRYAVGTAIDLPIDSNEHYILWALSTFDENLKAHTSMQDYALAVQKLIEACNNESEGFSIVMPLVGAGLSRTNRNQNEILRYLISAFEINKELLNCDVHIIVREDLKNEIAIMDLK